MGEVSLDRGCPAPSGDPYRVENRSSRPARASVFESILVDRIGCCRCLNDHVDLWPSEAARTARLRRIEFSYRWPVGYRGGSNFSSDASLNTRAGELVDRLCCGVESDHFASSELLVAARFRAGAVLFRLHLAALCGKSQRPTRHSRLLLRA